MFVLLCVTYLKVMCNINDHLSLVSADGTAQNIWSIYTQQNLRLSDHFWHMQTSKFGFCVQCSQWYFWLGTFAIKEDKWHHITRGFGAASETNTSLVRVSVSVCV